MDKLYKKVEAIKDLIKALKESGKSHNVPKFPELPSIKGPTPPSPIPMKPPGKVKDMPVGQAPDGKKDPKKIAEQIKNGSMSSKTQKVMLKNNGQWYLEKASANPDNEPKEAKIKQLQSQIDAGTYKPDSKKIANKMFEVKLHKNGQWDLNKSEFHIHKDGHQITAKPVTLDQVKNQYGSVQRLESSGHMLVPAKKSN